MENDSVRLVKPSTVSAQRVRAISVQGPTYKAEATSSEVKCLTGRARFDVVYESNSVGGAMSKSRVPGGLLETSMNRVGAEKRD